MWSVWALWERMKESADFKDILRLAQVNQAITELWGFPFFQLEPCVPAKLSLALSNYLISLRAKGQPLTYHSMESMTFLTFIQRPTAIV